VTLARYLEITGRDVEDVYGERGGWSALQHEAGVRPKLDEAEIELSRRIGRLLHVDDQARLATWTGLRKQPSAIQDRDRRLYAMLGYQLEHRGVLKAAEAVSSYMTKDEAIAAELSELREVLHERIALPYDDYPVADWPLALHKHYSRREIVAAVGYVKAGEKGNLPQAGILKLEATQQELLFVTLDKSGRSFSPTTRYRDYAISPMRFHWETQSSASVARPSGRRYLESPANGWSFHLFVRTDPHAAYAYVGPVTYLAHEGDRPIAITWQLAHALPARLYQRYATLAQG
jgi:hypothetical protein